jgi:hypothetical protein
MDAPIVRATAKCAVDCGLTDGEAGEYPWYLAILPTLQEHVKHGECGLITEVRTAPYIQNEADHRNSDRQ